MALAIRVTSQDHDATLVQNIGSTIVKKNPVKISGDEVMSVMIGMYDQLTENCGKQH